ncbi:hypothetical protein [Siphonobacter sp.]|uniref:hypothetical protein n=1 Tax=Siphonobacter sp. TaxID=1869184 RepID=UPI003B3AEE99
MKRILALGGLLLVLVSCEKEKIYRDDSERLRGMEQEILAFIQDKACQSERVCGSIAFGSKPCGGPWKYLVYSLKAADVARLEEKVRSYNQLEKKVNTREGKISDCVQVTPVTVDCIDGQCLPYTVKD